MASSIVIDRREPDWIAQGLSSRGWEVTIAELPCGDYLCPLPSGGVAAIERKTVSDFLSSFASGRLSEQLRELLTSYQVPVLLLEGELRMDPDGMVRQQGIRTGWHYSAVEGVLLGLQLAGLYVYRWPALDPPGSVSRIFTLLSKSSHDFLSRKSRPPVVTLDPAHTYEVLCLASLPGIGPETAAALLQEYGSIWNVMQALVHDPGAVESVKTGGKRLGKIRTEKLRNAILGAHRESFVRSIGHDGGSTPPASTEG